MSDTHLDHYNIALHCNRTPWLIPNPDFNPNLPEHKKTNAKHLVKLEEFNYDFIKSYNNIVSTRDLTYIIGDFAWKRHSHFIQALNGKKILILGNHDKMDQNSLRLFTEVHTLFRRIIDGIDVTMCHFPMISWANSIHGSWCLHGHCHGRLPENRSRLTFDVGIDIWNYKPIPWELVKFKMSKFNRAGCDVIDFTESDNHFEDLKKSNELIIAEFEGGKI